MYERVFVFEVAGPTLNFLRERRESLPSIRRFFDEGGFGVLRGPLQPVTPQSFATLLTGRNPGATGLFDFFQLPAGSYERVPYGSHLLRVPTFYQRLSDAGKRVGLLNVPLTFPLPQVDGFVVSGDDSAGENFAVPADLGRLLRDHGYRVPFGASYATGREPQFAEHAMAVLAMRRRAFRTLFASGGWDFGMLTLHLYGELLHAFWKYYDRSHPAYRPAAEVFDGRDPLLEALQGIDALLGEMIELAGPRGLVLFLGAWGHRITHATVHLNTLLAREGYLRFRPGARTRMKRLMFSAGLTAQLAERVARRLNLYRLFHYKVGRGQRAKVTGAAFLSYGDIDWARTRAVAMGYLGQIYLNVQGRRPLGTIALDSYAAEREQLRRLVADLRDPRTGAPMVDRVFTRDEIYRGPELDNAPDLVVDWKPGYCGDGTFMGSGRIVSPCPPTQSSDHWNQSAVLALGAQVRKGELTASLEDLAPTILRALGVDPPPDLDGTVLPLVG